MAVRFPLPPFVSSTHETDPSSPFRSYFCTPPTRAVERARPRDDRLRWSRGHVRKTSFPDSLFSSSPLSHESRGKISSLFILFSLLSSSFLLPDAHQPGFLTGSRRSWIGEQVRFPSPLLRSILTILNILLLLRLFSFRFSLSLPSSSLSFTFLHPRCSVAWRGKGSLYHWRDACTPCRRWLWTHP